MLSVCAFLLAYYWYFVLTWMPSYLTMSRGFSTVQMGRVFSTPLFAMAVCNLLAGWLADKLAHRTNRALIVRTRFAIAGLFGASSLLLLSRVRAGGVVIVLAASMCSFGIANSNFWAVAQHLAPTSLVGRVIGYLNTVSQIGGAAAPLITGWTLGPQKNFSFGIVIAALASLVACALFVVAGAQSLEKLKSHLDAGVRAV
jgi:MFS family permease